MKRIEWHEGLSLGIEKLDNQHKHLIELANMLALTARQADYKEMSDCFCKFREHALYHFNDEEAFMERVRYPKRDEHAQQHSLLKKKVKQFQDVLYRHEIILEEEIVNFLKMWLIGHVIKNDLPIKDFLKTSST
jgi:hemerythrin